MSRLKKKFKKNNLNLNMELFDDNNSGKEQEI